MTQDGCDVCLIHFAECQILSHTGRLIQANAVIEHIVFGRIRRKRLLAKADHGIVLSTADELSKQSERWLRQYIDDGVEYSCRRSITGDITN